MTGIATTQSSIAIGFCFPIIGGILVALRLFTRRHQKVDLRLDDWLCLPAWLCVTGSCASLLTGIFKNAFVEAPISGPDNVPEQQRILAQVTAAQVIFWMAANTLIKLAIIFFYRRIFVGRSFQICNWTLFGLSLLWFVYAVLSWLLYCGKHLQENFEGGWRACDPWGFDLQMGVFVLDSLIDFFLLILPIPFVWRLQLKFKRKIVVIIVFLLGGLAFVAGLNNTIVQLVYLTNPAFAESGGAGNFFQGSSLLFSNWPPIEIGVGLIACNIPSLSFRAANALPKAIQRGLELSWSGLRHAAATLSLRSSNRHSRIKDTRGATHAEDAAIDGYQKQSDLEQQSSRSTSTEMPLVKFGLKTDEGGIETRRGLEEGYSAGQSRHNTVVVRGLDVV